MRVLKGRVLVTIDTKKTESELIIEQADDVRKGVVYLSGSEEVHPNEEVMFGDEFEEIQMSGDHRAFLMSDENIKLIFGEKNV